MFVRGRSMKRDEFDFVDKTNMSLLTDFYELTMCASYFEKGKDESATFDLFIRKMPSNRSYYVFAGLEQVLFFLKNIEFHEEYLKYLKKKGLRGKFLDYLRGFRVTGEVWAVPEGSVVFQDEPLIRVTAPIVEAQLVETFILNTVNLQTMITTKASRVIHAAAGRSVVEERARRRRNEGSQMQLHCWGEWNIERACRAKVWNSIVWHDGSLLRYVF
jgi:nicotinate phosphoribosyltransferase